MNYQEEIDRAGGFASWLDTEVPADEISEKEGGLFQDIRVVENLLDAYTSKSWGRKNHNYEFHTITVDGHTETYLSTSIEIHLGCEDGRVLIGGSMLKLTDYAENPNIVMTGVSEATKAAVKVLGRRFGKDLNEESGAGRRPETNRKTTVKRAPVLMKPDKKIMNEYLQAVCAGDKQKIEKMKSIYDIKVEEV